MSRKPEIPDNLNPDSMKLSDILDVNPIATFVINTESKITHWNRACELLTGIPAANVIGTDAHREAFYTERREVMADILLREGSALEWAMHYGNRYKKSALVKGGYEGRDFFPKLGDHGKWLFFCVAPIKNADGDIVGVIETIQDITEHHLAEEALITSEARYRQLFESANDSIFILQNDIVSNCNNKALELFQCEKKDLIGCTPNTLSPEFQADGTSSEGRVDRRIHLLSKGHPQFFEWRFLRKNGSLFDAEVSLTHFQAADGVNGLAIIRDITERKKMLQALQDRQKALNEKTTYLEKVNQALKDSLDHREIEKRAVEENILIDLKKFVFPYLKSLKENDLGVENNAYVEIVLRNLNGLVDQKSTTLASKYIDLTPAEIRIANFIREGKNTKTIADTLKISIASVKWHRRNIRQKLGLSNEKINLQTYLISFSR